MVQLSPEYFTLPLADGYNVKLYFNFARWKALRNIDKKSYEAINKCLAVGCEDAEQLIDCAYGCYVMANMGEHYQTNPETLLNKGEFECLVDSPADISDALNQIFVKKKRIVSVAASATASAAEPAK